MARPDAGPGTENRNRVSWGPCARCLPFLAPYRALMSLPILALVTDGDDFVDAALSCAPVIDTFGSGEPNCWHQYLCAALISQGCWRRHGLRLCACNPLWREGSSLISARPCFRPRHFIEPPRSTRTLMTGERAQPDHDRHDVDSVG